MREESHQLLTDVLAGEHIGPILIACAHPDDETLFATSVLLRHVHDTFVVHLTDGAPEDIRARAPGYHDRTRAAYAAERGRELAGALHTLGLPSHQRVSIPIVDQCLVFRLAQVVPRLCLLLQERAPRIVFTHAYEGGHPDHDAASLAVKLAVMQARQLGAPTPVIAEFASYHGRPGAYPGVVTLVPMQFDDTRHATDAASRVCTVSLTMRERHLKRAALACYTSQQYVIQQFPVDTERYRLAPAYDYTQPPSASVMYEQWWGHWMDARRWCRVAAPALGGLGLSRSPVHAHDRQRRVSARAGRP
jgi:LmbE family N-acetylglucosaminyl deacetylase